MRNRTLVTFSAAGLLLLGCGGDPPPDDAVTDGSAAVDDGAADGSDVVGGEPTPDGATPPSEDACELLDPDTIEAATGTEVDEGTRADLPPAAACTWEGEAGPVVSLSVIAAADLAAGESIEDGFEEIRTMGQGPDAEPVEGLGVDAFATPLGVTVLLEDAILSVDDFSGGEAAEELAREAIANR